jgi:hypothetical protein
MVLVVAVSAAARGVADLRAPLDESPGNGGNSVDQIVE